MQGIELEKKFRQVLGERKNIRTKICEKICRAYVYTFIDK